MHNIASIEEPLQFISVRDIQTAANHPYLIDKLIPERSVALLSAPSNAGKTAMLVHLSTCLAEQQQAFGALTVHNDSRRPVFYINAEMTAPDFKQYAIASARGVGLSAGAQRLLLPGNGERGQLFFGDGRREQFNRLSRAIDEHKPILVVLDTLRSLFAVDENDQEQIGIIARSLHALVAAHDCSIIIAHHNRKPGAFGFGGAQAAVAGSAHIVGMADVHIALRATEGKFANRLDVIKDRRRTDGGAIAFGIAASLCNGVSRISLQPLQQQRQDKDADALDAIRKIGPATQAALIEAGIARRKIAHLRRQGLLREAGRKGRGILLEAA